MTLESVTEDSFFRFSAPPKEEVILCRRNLQVLNQISSYAQSAFVVVAMPLHNQASTLHEALISALSQTLTKGHCAVVLLDDQSSDDWQSQIGNLIDHPAVIILRGHCGTPALSRNAILDFVESELPKAQWVARLDPDDVLCSSNSVDALVSAGELKNASFVLGSNQLVVDRLSFKPDNIANPEILLNSERLVQFIEDFCSGRESQELPSCNLIIRTNRGIRYPSTPSAEDHWLVAQLLIFRSSEATILSYPVYCSYSLSGQTTTSNAKIGAYRSLREDLASASRDWLAALSESDRLLGFGMEGCVWQQGDFILKKFYRHTAKYFNIEGIAEASINANGRIPEFEYLPGFPEAIRYKAVVFTSIGKHIAEVEVRNFLLDLARAGLVASNIKRENLSYAAGRLTYIDIGRDILLYTPSAFLDSAARLYAIGILGWPDGELLRRKSWGKQHDELTKINGFTDFFNGLVVDLYPLSKLPQVPERYLQIAEEVTLLIKACPQDHKVFLEQVAHIVYQLSAPRRFAKVVVAIDPFVGTYLRHYSDGDLTSILNDANVLKDKGVIDDVWVAKQDASLIDATYRKWFAIDKIKTTHTSSGAPLFAQLWAFDQVPTRFVLQADLDVLIGRKDQDHDYLQDMLEAIQPTDVWCVGFNIPKKENGFVPYWTALNGFVPEIRLGLLDLEKIRAGLPLPNEISNGNLKMMWHRSMEEAQRILSMKTVRGGDDRTFYIHPTNIQKQLYDLEVERDLIAQGTYPALQAEQWDLALDSKWQYPMRTEDLVFLLKGRDTPLSKLIRCLESLRQQSDLEFGIILIDDASSPQHAWQLNHYLGSLKTKTTLVRNRVHRGYIPNFLLASELCLHSETMIVVLDQDDVLMSSTIVAKLKQAKSNGVDLINGLMYRPNKPTKLYFADYENPRSKGGGNTWTHLRAFKKALFDSVPIDEYQIDGDWISDISDYATMLPMAEIARKPMQLVDQYYVWHEREDYSSNRKKMQGDLLCQLLNRQVLIRENFEY